MIAGGDAFSTREPRLQPTRLDRPPGGHVGADILRRPLAKGAPHLATAGWQHGEQIALSGLGRLENGDQVDVQRRWAHRIGHAGIVP